MQPARRLSSFYTELSEYITQRCRNCLIVVNYDYQIYSINASAQTLLEKLSKKGKIIEESILFSILDAVKNSTKSEILIQNDSFTLKIRHESSENFIFVSLQDITRQNKLETIRTEFVANLAHEIKTPLTIIKGNVDTLIEYPELKHNQREIFLGAVSRQSDRINGIFEMITLLSEVELDERCIPKEVFLARDLFEDVNDAVGNSAKQLDVKITFFGENQQIFGNRIFLSQALINLVENSIKYSVQDGEVSISVKPDDQGNTSIVVQDNGPGISPEHQTRIFERFYRIDHGRARKDGGSGIGLALVKHIVLAHEGTIFLRSESGEGATFIIKLPYIPEVNA